MDTPEKKPLPSPSLLSKFEDSPVFNYISSLSPIKPFKSGHSGQSFHLLTFASPQSSQASPAICPKEPNITSALHVSDAPKNCSESGYEGGIAGNSGAAQSADVKAKEDEFDSGGEVTVRATEESSKLIIELPKSLKYDSGSPENVVVNCDAVKQDDDFNVAGTEIAPLKVIQHFSKEADCSFENEMGVQRSEVEQNKGVCDWEKFIYEASDILKYCSPIKEKHHEELGDRNVDTGMLSFVSTVLQPPHENVDETQKMESACPHMSSESHTKITLTQPGAGKPHETSLAPAVQAHSVLAEEVVHSAGMDDKEQQTTRRRCLVYEMSGAHYRKLLSDPVDTSPTSKAPASPKTTYEKCLGASRPGSNKFTTLLPGIGLHLNALAAKSREKIIVRRQTLTCRRQLISSPRIMPSCDTHTSDPKPLNIQNPSSDTHTSGTKPLNIQNSPDIVGKDGNEQADEVLMAENACQISPCGDGTELHRSSPKKKRRKSDVGENESCKRCNCKRSKCLKLYCECFAAGLYCVEPCNCQDCFNKPIHEETVLETRRQIESRNPLAFAPKVIKCSSTPHTGDEANKTPASARHKRGCNCKKSGCLKKYCECFQGGVGCSLSCRCEGCKNTFGRKEGIDSIVIYKETQMLEKSTTDSCSQDEVSKTYEENQKQEIPVPSKSARQPVRHPYHFGGMVPHSISLPSGTSLQRCKAEKIDKSDDSAIDDDVMITLNDEDPEILQGDYSLPTCVKSASPNCKRVSPPHCDYETSPGWKSCRKVILRSIPPFPSMSPEKKKHTVAAKDPMK